MAHIALLGNGVALPQLSRQLARLVNLHICSEETFRQAGGRGGGEWAGAAALLLNQRRTSLAMPTSRHAPPSTTCAFSRTKALAAAWPMPAGRIGRNGSGAGASGAGGAVKQWPSTAAWPPQWRNYRCSIVHFATSTVRNGRLAASPGQCWPYHPCPPPEAPPVITATLFSSIDRLLQGFDTERAGCDLHMWAFQSSSEPGHRSLPECSVRLNTLQCTKSWRRGLLSTSLQAQLAQQLSLAPKRRQRAGSRDHAAGGCCRHADARLAAGQFGDLAGVN